jgi:uncharacterized membrane protein
MTASAAGPTKKPGFAGFLERIYKPLGFTKVYNFVLFVLLVGALMGFTLARLSYFNLTGILCRPDGDPRAITNATPGECYYLLRNPYMTGMIVHLAAILPASFLACFQFVPKIRHKVILIHRMNGYTIIVLSILATAGALVIARHSFGGGLDSQAAIGFLAIIFLLSNLMAYINVKRLQIEQHRAWMLRAWVYVSSASLWRLLTTCFSHILRARLDQQSRHASYSTQAVPASPHWVVSFTPCRVPRSRGSWGARKTHWVSIPTVPPLLTVPTRRSRLLFSAPCGATGPRQPQHTT